MKTYMFPIFLSLSVFPGSIISAQYPASKARLPGEKRPAAAALPEESAGSYHVAGSGIAYCLAMSGDKANLDMLVNALYDESVSVRKTAVSALANERKTQFIRPIFIALSDSENEVRQHALNTLFYLQETAPDLLWESIQAENSVMRSGMVEMLRQLKDRKAAKILMPMLKDNDPAVLKAVISTLGQLDEKTALPPLIETLKSGDAEIRAAAITAIAGIGGEEADEILVERLVNGTLSEKIRAASSLKGRKNPKAVEPLIHSLASDYRELRICSAAALGEIKAPEAVDPLLEALEKEEHERTRGTIAEALGNIGDNRAVEPLLKILNASPWFVKMRCIEALGKIGDERAFKPLTETLKDQNTAIRKASVTAVGNIKNPATIDILISSLNDREDDVKHAAALSLARLGVQAVKPLAEALRNKTVTGHNEQYIRIALDKMDSGCTGSIIEGLLDADKQTGELLNNVLYWNTGQNPGRDYASWKKWLDEKEKFPEGPPEVFRRAGITIKQVPGNIPEFLRRQMELLFSPDDSKRIAATAAIGDLKESASPAIPLLVIQLKDANWNVRRATVLALGQTGSKDITDNLINMLADPEINVRNAAFTSLGRLNEPRAVKAITGYMEDSDTFTRRIAVKALRMSMDGEITDILIERMKKDRDVFVRTAIIDILAERKEAKAVEPIIAILKERDITLIRKAVEALGIFKDPRATEPLIDELAMSRINLAAVIKALGEIGDVRAEEPLKKLSGDPRLRNSPVLEEVLARIHGISFNQGPLLPKEKIPGDISPVLRDQIARLYSSDTLKRLYAAADIGKRAPDAERAIPYLVSMLGDNAETKTSWAGATTPGEAAARTLSKFKEQAVFPLLNALEDKNWYARKNAARALGTIGDSRATAGLIERLKDEISWVRQDALYALKKVTGKDFGYDCERWKEWLGENKATF